MAKKPSTKERLDKLEREMAIAIDEQDKTDAAISRIIAKLRVHKEYSEKMVIFIGHWEHPIPHEITDTIEEM